MKITQDQIEEQRIKAHEFSTALLPQLIASVTSVVLDYNVKIIEERRLEIKGGASDEVEEEFRKFQNNLMTNACQNVRSITLQIVGGITSDYFPDLVAAQQQQKENGNQDQAQGTQTSPPRGSVFIESQEVVGKPEVRVS